jgi:hypothetical protein
MSIKVRSLGSVAAAARGIVITGGTNATPIVATITAGHRLKNGDRLGITGVTTLTSMNGDFSFDTVAATTANLTGSAGNGAYAGTAVTAILCDRTPFIQRHSGCVAISNLPGNTVFVGTAVLEYADRMDATLANFQYDASGVATNGFNSALLGGEQAIPAFTAGGDVMVEVSIGRYMALRASAWTSGAADGYLLA